MIVTEITPIKAVLTTLANEIEFEDFETYVKDAEDWIASEILGDTIYGNIEDSSFSDKKLIRLTTNCIVLKSYELGIPFMDLIQTNNGFGVISDKNRAPASKARVDRMIKQNTLRLNTNIENLINHLEDTATYHDDWKSSPAYSLLTNCLIITAREFKRYAKFEGDRNGFLFLKPILINKTNTFLFQNISKTYTKELIAKQNAGTLTNADKDILPGIKQALANIVLENEMLAGSLLADVLNTMYDDPDNYATYHASDEKALKDDPGHENTAEDPIFVFKGGM